MKKLRYLTFINKLKGGIFISNKPILKWEIIGFLAITILGSAFHFCYEWSGSWKPVALFCAVNESVWEHLKIGFWPAVFYSVAEYFAFGKNNRNFLFAKTLAFYSIPIVITLGYYLLVAVIGEHSVWLDIALFVVAILISQSISYKIIVSKRDYGRFKLLTYILLVLIIAAFSLFTYFPPKLELFKNPHTDGYGIP